MALIAPLLVFVVITFIVPITSMLFRSVENEIVQNTLPNAVAALASWDSTKGDLPDEAVFEAMYFDMFLAAEAKRHTRLGTRLNYETTGMSSLFRQSGRKLDDLGKDIQKPLEALNADWKDETIWFELMSGAETDPTNQQLIFNQQQRIFNLLGVPRRSWLATFFCKIGSVLARPCGTAPEDIDIGFNPSLAISEILPKTTQEYTAFAFFTVVNDNDIVAEEAPWESVAVALAADLQAADLTAYDGPGADLLREAQAADLPAPNFTAAFAGIDDDWATSGPWETLQTHSSTYTSGYFLNAVDAQKSPDGVAWQPENKQIPVSYTHLTLPTTPYV